MPGFTQVVRCTRCGNTVSTEVGMDSRCSRCGVDLRSCVQCQSFEPGARFECREQIAARITPKDVRNTCELYHPTVRVERETGSPAPTSARKALTICSNREPHIRPRGGGPVGRPTCPARHAQSQLFLAVPDASLDFALLIRLLGGCAILARGRLEGGPRVPFFASARKCAKAGAGMHGHAFQNSGFRYGISRLKPEIVSMWTGTPGHSSSKSVK